MNIFRSSAKLFVANIFGAAVHFIGITFFARSLGASGIGIFFLFQALLGILSIPADLGMRGAVEKRVSEDSESGKYLSSVLLLKTLPIVAIVVGILYFSKLINEYTGAEVAFLLAIAIALHEIAHLSLAILRAELRVGETALLTVVRQMTWVLLGAILITYGFGNKALIYSLLAGIFLQLLLGWYKITTPLERPSISHMQSLFRFGRHSFISSVGAYLYNWMDVAVIGLFLTQAHVGAYEIAWQVTIFSVLLSHAIASSVFPQMSKWHAEGAENRIQGLFRSAVIPSVFLVIPSLFGAILYSEEILHHVFGEEYAVAAVVLVVLMVEKVFQSIQTVVGRALQSLDRPDMAARATIVSIVLNGSLNLVLVYKFGILGAAIATAFSSLVGQMLHYAYLRRLIELTFPLRGVAECIAATLLMSGTLIIFQSELQITGLITLSIHIVVGMVSYILYALGMPNLRPMILGVAGQLRKT